MEQHQGVGTLDSRNDDIATGTGRDKDWDEERETQEIATPVLCECLGVSVGVGMGVGMGVGVCGFGCSCSFAPVFQNTVHGQTRGPAGCSLTTVRNHFAVALP
jgi:hypothetical protein